ncbi:MAG: two-component sensor histidine kinase [Streptosporangiales bacterium]|nr:two-component sensor histidine kinase [Streptosporangiales bacterium]
MFSPNDPWLPFAAVVAAYTAAAHAPYRPLTWVLLVVLTGVVTRAWQPHVDVITGGLLLTVMPALLGLYFGARRRLEDALRERVERAEREQHLMAERARADERARLAAEMHDVVTHRVSLMVLQAGALTVSTRDEGTRAAADELRVTGCQALDELRDLVGVLQATPGEAEGEGTVGAGGRPSALDLRALAVEADSVGGEVELVEEGHAGSLSPAVARTAYRIVQEALTNVRKHAPGAAAQVRVRYGSDRMRLVVHNGPTAQRPDEALVVRGSHRGLAGLRQRVELVGGTFEASADGAEGSWSRRCCLRTYRLVRCASDEREPAGAGGRRRRRADGVRAPEGDPELGA